MRVVILNKFSAVRLPSDNKYSQQSRDRPAFAKLRVRDGLASESPCKIGAMVRTTMLISQVLDKEGGGVTNLESLGRSLELHFLYLHGCSRSTQKCFLDKDSDFQ